MMWKEEDHPRDDDGKFTDGNGTGAKSGSIRVGEGQPAEWEDEKESTPITTITDEAIDKIERARIFA